MGDNGKPHPAVVDGKETTDGYFNGLSVPSCLGGHFGEAFAGFDERLVEVAEVTGPVVPARVLRLCTAADVLRRLQTGMGLCCADRFEPARGLRIEAAKHRLDAGQALVLNAAKDTALDVRVLRRLSRSSRRSGGACRISFEPQLNRRPA